MPGVSQVVLVVVTTCLKSSVCVCVCVCSASRQGREEGDASRVILLVRLVLSNYYY